MDSVTVDEARPYPELHPIGPSPSAHSPLPKDVMDGKENPSFLPAGYAMVHGTIIIALLASEAPVTNEGLGPITLDFNKMNVIDFEEIVQLGSAKVASDGSSESMVVQQPEAEPTVELALERDDTYYLAMALIQTVDEVQFLVPQHRFLEHADRVLIHAKDQDQDSAMPLDVSSEDFRGLMELMYPLHGHGLQARHWISVLKLSTKWMALEYRQQAIASLNKKSLPPEELIVLGRTYGVPSWFRQGCIAFAKAEVHLDACHEETLGIDAMIKITHARDKAFASDMRLYHRRLSTRYPPNDILSKFVDAAGAEDPADTDITQRILSARMADNLDALRYCYSQLIDREESISLAEAVSLKLGTTVVIWKTRYELLCKYRQILSDLGPVVGTRPQLDFASCIEHEFADEFGVAKTFYDLLDPTPPLPPHRSPSPVEFEPKWCPNAAGEPSSMEIAEPEEKAAAGGKKKKKKKLGSVLSSY